MKLDQSPFPPGWWGISLDNVGLESQRPDVGTYGCYEFSNLPALPLTLDGKFSWLQEAQIHDGHIGVEREADNIRALPKLEETCVASGVQLPSSFVTFVGTPQLHTRIRSNTDCFLDLAEGPVPSPMGDGALIRFLADSQGCMFWYLFVPSGSSDHAIVSCPRFFDPEPGYYEDDDDDYDYDETYPLEPVFSEVSFEAFICRFWIENELWFSEYDGTPMSEFGRRYLEAYRASPPDKLRG